MDALEKTKTYPTNHDQWISRLRSIGANNAVSLAACKQASLLSIETCEKAMIQIDIMRNLSYDL